MFILDPHPEFTRTVKVRTPAGTGFRDETFSATFVALPVDEFAAFDLASAAGSSDFLTRVLAGVGDVVDADSKQPFEDGPVLRRALIGLPHVRPALVRAYLDSVAEAARGN